MDDQEVIERVNVIKQYLLNTQHAPNSLPRSFYPTTTNPTATTTTDPTATTTTDPTATTTTYTTTARTIAASNVLPRNTRRAMQFLDDFTDGPVFGGYNAYSPYNRSYMNMYMGGYSPYNSYGQPMTNPVIQAADENVLPAFESILSVVQSFNTISMMLSSSIAAIQMSMQASSDLTENFSRMRKFMMNLYSTILSFKLARWFLTKIIYLIRMVKGDRGTNVEEEILSSLSSTAQGEVVPSVERSWPLMVFTGIIVSTPFFLYKLLNTVVPTPKSLPPMNNTNKLASGSEFVIVSQNDWSSMQPKTIPLVKGQNYWTSNSYMRKCFKNGGWLYVRNANGQKGFVPLKFLQQSRTDHIHPLLQPSLLEEDLEVEVPIESPVRTPITVANVNPNILPHPPMDDPLENNTQ